MPDRICFKFSFIFTTYSFTYFLTIFIFFRLLFMKIQSYELYLIKT